jgi:uncharacterized FAD-dependent dehydrogenase
MHRFRGEEELLKSSSISWKSSIDGFKQRLEKVNKLDRCLDLVRDLNVLIRQFKGNRVAKPKPELAGEIKAKLAHLEKLTTEAETAAQLEKLTTEAETAVGTDSTEQLVRDLKADMEKADMEMKHKAEMKKVRADQQKALDMRDNNERGLRKQVTELNNMIGSLHAHIESLKESNGYFVSQSTLNEALTQLERCQAKVKTCEANLQILQGSNKPTQ